MFTATQTEPTAVTLATVPSPGMKEFFCLTCEVVTAFDDIRRENGVWGFCENEHWENLGNVDRYISGLECYL